MRKLLFSVALIAYAGVSAQTFGVKGGVNISNVSNLYESQASPKSKTGFNVGFFMNKSISQNLNVQPELIFNSKGLKYKYGTDELNYISLPIMFQYKFLDNLYIEGGPEFSLLLSAKDKFNGNDNYEAENIDYTDELKKLDVGLGVGLGYDINQNFGANVRYVAGLTDIWKETTEGDVAKNSVFQIGVYYKFSK